MKAVIIYEDVLSATNAKTVLQRSTHGAGTSVKWNVCPWRLDMLKVPPTAEDALTEAMDAHLIVFAGFNGQPIPSWLQDWFENWAKSRQIDGAALAVINDDGVDRPSTSVRNDL